MADEQPLRTSRSDRAQEVITCAWTVLEKDGREALTMRRLADELGIKAPSLYKHLPDKAALEAALVEEGLAAMGTALHDAAARPGRAGPVAAVLATYRRYGIDNPNLYRLTTSGRLPRERLPAGLEAWAGTPFFLATGDPHRAQAMWAFAHGMVVLEIDGRFMDTSHLDRTWRAGAAAFNP